ncbi:hypothetical protein K491DRAFT_696780 [Lophiostoma macrostomum CBS 122681]|uniref:Uncharacterized protein n=1 Tax=Lophiostoma macrostomum CBS 122681 TaxID=1314788 RepID=A0A6A6SWV3_9PLEO|nr:hypothetical protein K491DRAFT_696780 [Lophiostoma macrostomum CBS 122681]
MVDARSPSRACTSTLWSISHREAYTCLESNAITHHIPYLHISLPLHLPKSPSAQPCMFHQSALPPALLSPCNLVSANSQRSPPQPPTGYRPVSSIAAPHPPHIPSPVLGNSATYSRKSCTIPRGVRSEDEHGDRIRAELTVEMEKDTLDG